jgi:glyoxylase-like metal-dependent hydrolase (beta-lactamase superfamily II)
MKEITPDILIETDYEGVTVGAIRTPDGVVMIDMPLNPKEASTWRTTCTRSTAGSDRLLVLLDEHPDRVTGAANIKCPVIVHERTAQAVTTRPSARNQASNAITAPWESAPESTNTRWVHAEITFTVSMTINWGETAILLEHHAGPAKGSIWVIEPDKRVAFIGDTVLANQPPFFANADLDTWLASLHELQLARFKDYILINGRGAMVTIDEVRAFEHFIIKTAKRLEKLTIKKVMTDEVEALSEEIMEGFSPRNRHEAESWKNRLVSGLTQYYNNHIPRKND